MVTVTKFIKNKLPLPNIRFWDDEKVGANIFFAPESSSQMVANEALQNYLSTQIKGYYHQITVPGIITNFLGKKLSSQKHYLEIKKDMPNFQYSRVPAKQTMPEKTNIFDFSGIITDILSTAKSRSQKLVFKELIKLIESVIKDYDSERKNYLFIMGDPKLDADASDILQFLSYINKLSAGKIKTTLDGIIYNMDGKYYPIAIPFDNKESEKELKFQRNILSMLLKRSVDSKNKIKIDETIETDDEVEAASKATKESVIEAIDKIASSNSSDIKESQKNIKAELDKIPELVGTFEEKLQSIYTKGSTTDAIDKLTKDINRKYNGNIKLDIKQNGVFNNQKIVGMDEVGNYDKQRLELTENIDDLIDDLIHSTLGNDPDVDIDIISIKKKIVDDNKNRYKEFQIKIKHKDFGLTTNKPYTISFRIPVPVQGKYIKLGGNNYILINQLFPKPIQKVAPNLVRFYTHFSVASLKLKNTKLSASNSFVEVEEKFVTQLKSMNAIKLENFDNATKDMISSKYGIDDLQGFKYSKMTIKA